MPTEPASRVPRLSGRKWLWNLRSHAATVRNECPQVGSHSGLPLEQVEALTRQQQRIERRSLILGCAVTTLEPAPMRDALADLLAEITEAARAIGMLLRPAG
jgi:hypothetical protein